MKNNNTSECEKKNLREEIEKYLQEQTRELEEKLQSHGTTGRKNKKHTQTD